MMKLMRLPLGFLALTALSVPLLLTGCASAPDTVQGKFMDFAEHGNISEAAALMSTPEDYYPKVVKGIVDGGCHFEGPVAAKVGTADVVTYTSKCDQSNGQSGGGVTLTFGLAADGKIHGISKTGGN